MSIRWRLSIFAWWIWLKVTPECNFKHAIIDAVAALGPRFHQPKETEHGQD